MTLYDGDDDDDDDDDDVFVCLFQARQSRLQCGLNVDVIDDVMTGFQTADQSSAGFTDLFIEELVTRMTQFTLSPNEIQQAVSRTTM